MEQNTKKSLKRNLISKKGGRNEYENQSNKSTIPIHKRVQVEKGKRRLKKKRKEKGGGRHI